MASTTSDPDLLTTAEAAKLLKVSPVTISRWLKQGRLPAYRLGPRAVRIRRTDLDSLLSPAYDEEHLPMSPVAYEPDPQEIDDELIASIEPLSDREVEELRAAMESARELREHMLAERGGRPLPPSWPLIREAREER